MNVLQITNYNYNQNQSTFGHHPDFKELIKNQPIKASTYFRKKFEQGSLTEFANFFKGDIKEPKKMLIVGVADSQEPFSYLTFLSQIRKDMPIEKLVDLHIIDLQSAPDNKKLLKDSYTMGINIPDYAKGGFVKDNINAYNFYNNKLEFMRDYYNLELNIYRVRDDLFEFLRKTYQDSQKSKWESRVQEAIKDFPDNYFDIVSMNFVMCYLPIEEKFPTLENIGRTIKNDGLFITEGDYYVENSSIIDNVQKIDCGVYKMVK